MTKVTGKGKYLNASFVPKDKKNNIKSRFPSLKTTKDLVLLSIEGNEFCAGEYLSAIVQQAVATHQTPADYSGVKGKTTFLIADEIYWHNLKGKLYSSDDEANLKKKALDLGEKYFESNLSAFLTPIGFSVDEFLNKYLDKTMDEKITIINQLALDQGKNFEIVRWHTWVTQNDFDKTLKDILPFYEEVEGLKVAIEKSVEEFVKRHATEGEERELWVERSRSYLKEESPSIMLLAGLLGYNFIIYPGDILPPFAATRDYFIVENHIARIEKGESVKKECTHNKFCLHCESPSRLVNWLDINFRRSNEKLVEKNEKVAGTMSFFSPEKSLGKKKNSHKKTTSTDIEEDVVKGELVPVPEGVASSIVEGINQALQYEFFPKDKSAKQTPSILTQVFAGITQSVLAADLPLSEKIGFMSGLIDSYVTPRTLLPGYSSSPKAYNKNFPGP